MIRECQVGVERPWLIHIWEPLRTKAPCPDKAMPYCCYLRTVIFYVGPRHIVRPWAHLYHWPPKSNIWTHDKPGQMYEKWDEIEYDLSWDDVFDWCGDRFIVGGGRVIWRLSQWWIKHWARRARCKVCETPIRSTGYSAVHCSKKCAMWRPGTLVPRPNVELA